MDTEKKRSLAEESVKTRRAREKLKKQLDAFDKKITPQALEAKATEIHQWIARHAALRVVLKTKGICLFDENQNAAELSQRVVQLADQLKADFQKASEVAASHFSK